MRAACRVLISRLSVALFLVWSSGNTAASPSHAVPLAPSATEIVRRGESLLRGRSSQMLTSMSVNRASYTRRLYLRTVSLGDSHSFIEIIKPIKEEGMVSLRIGGEIWNYLPKTDQIVRVPTSMLGQSWMGSDFTNDDLLKVSSLANDYNHREVSRRGNEILIECVPKPNEAVVWAKVNYRARARDWMPLKHEYFDGDGKLVRTLTFSDFQRLDDRTIPTTARLDSADRPGEFTEIHHDKALFDRAIPQSLFEQRRLKKTAEAARNINTGWISTPLN